MEHVTKEDLKNELHALEQRIEGKIDASEQRTLDKVAELIHDSETRILNAFYGATESSRKRIATVEVAGTLMVSRLGTLEDRVTDIERRLNLPPAS